MDSLKERNKKNRALERSIHTAYLLLLSLVLLLIVVSMIAANVGYDYIMNEADTMIRSADKPTGIVKYIINTEAASKKISELIEYVIILEKNMSETIKFTSAQVVSFIVALILSLIATASKFKNSLNANRRSKKRNALLDIILKFVAGTLLVLLIIISTASQLLAVNIFIIIVLQLLIYFILALMIYYTLIKGKKSFIMLSISSITSSVLIILSTYVLKAITLILPMDGNAYTSMVYTIFFILSLAFIPYMLITGHELGFLIAKKNE